MLETVTTWDFLSGPIIEISLSNAEGVGSVPGEELIIHMPPTKTET